MIPDREKNWAGRHQPLNYREPANPFLGDKNLKTTNEGGVVVDFRREAKVRTADDANPKDRLGMNKIPLAWVPPAASIYMARAFEIGGLKYGPYNWRRKKVKMMVYLHAILRHAACLIDGEDVDAEGNTHEGAIMACAGIIADARETGNLIDDRPEKGVASELIERWKKTS